MTTDAVATNRKAHHEYFLLDKYEAGIALKGSEVKSIREGRVNLQEAFVRVMSGEVYLVNMHISQYSHTHDFAPEPTRLRKLLLKRNEIERILGQMSRKGIACVPLRVYFKRGFVKIEIALAQKRKAHDKRQMLKERIHKREIDKEMKSRLKPGR